MDRFIIRLGRGRLEDRQQSLTQKPKEKLQATGNKRKMVHTQHTPENHQQVTSSRLANLGLAAAGVTKRSKLVHLSMEHSTSRQNQSVSDPSGGKSSDLTKLKQHDVLAWVERKLQDDNSVVDLTDDRATATPSCRAAISEPERYKPLSLIKETSSLSGSALRADELARLRQASMAEFLQKTNQHSSSGRYHGAGCSAYDVIQQQSALCAVKKDFKQFGRQSQHVFPDRLGNLLCRRMKLMKSVSLPGSRPEQCSKLKFDKEGILFAVGHTGGSIDIFDFDECLHIARKRDHVPEDIASESGTTMPNSHTVLIEPACQLRTHKRADVVDITWLPRSARPLKSQRPYSNEICNNVEEDMDCLLAIIFANDPFVYLYDVEQNSGRPFSTLQHREGGSNSCIHHFCLPSNKFAPQNHQLLAGSRNGRIRLWAVNNTKEPNWTIPADPRGAESFIGSVVSLMVLNVNDVITPSNEKNVNSKTDIQSNDDPYAIKDNNTIGGALNSITKTHPKSTLVVSVTSLGILCVWDITEKRCRSNTPAFGFSSSYWPINLRRTDLACWSLGGRVISVQYQDSAVDSGNPDFKAYALLSSGSLVCVDILSCDITHEYRLGTSPRCAVTLSCPESNSLVLIDSDSLGNAYCSVSCDRITKIVYNGKHSCKNSYLHVQSSEYPQFTLPGQIWAISKKYAPGTGNVATVLECSEDVAHYIGFSGSKSKYVWLQVEKGSFRDPVEKDFVERDVCLQGQSSSEQGMVQCKKVLQCNIYGTRYTARSVRGNTIELCEEYCGPYVDKGYPLVQLRTNLGLKGDVPSDNNTKDQLRDTKLERVELDSDVCALEAHPNLLYTICGSHDGSVKIIAGDLSDDGRGIEATADEKLSVTDPGDNRQTNRVEESERTLGDLTLVNGSM